MMSGSSTTVFFWVSAHARISAHPPFLAVTARVCYATHGSTSVNFVGEITLVIDLIS